MNLYLFCFDLVQFLYLILDKSQLQIQTTQKQDRIGTTRVIHSYVVNDKIDIFLLFWPDSESFGK